ncbi:Outer membrane protein TolC [Mucilaginibacter mallensis]|uniref:Outer membrane protein TolC n=1 Tax=Mucilaginibacter mallensis TaxID=652787 RepID=A0A1H1ZAI9_MUCMA|nr:TolC family protein [Mucilaginibacter mallensis]SDT30781.1 Outer membrane protein TolC [Mucilaginibacter mallensis]
MKKIYLLLLINLTLCLPRVVFGQASTDTVVTLKQCIEFALRNQPAVRQAAIDEQINEKDVKIGLAGWLPQLSSSGEYEHYFKGSVPVAFSTGTTSTTTGQTVAAPNLDEYSSLGLQASQVIYNSDVLLAAKTANYSRLYYKQNTLSSQINVLSDVSKAFFDVLLSQKQLDILNEDIVRLQRSLKDSYSKYQAGTADKTDYKQATIALNNSIASRKQTTESIKAKLAYLKQIMGVKAGTTLTLAYDSAHYESEAYIDTNQQLDYNKRIEYQQLQTTKTLQNINVSYYKWQFLPSVSAIGAYSLNYISSKFSSLYNNDYPSGYYGLTLSFPIFQGTKRLQNLSKARLQSSRADIDIENSQNTINTEYVQALASYKSNYTNWEILKQNVDLAKDVYKVVSLQYREGIKTYLDVIVAQSDLRTAELNYYNALFQLLSSKIDLEKALGTLTPQSN